MLTLEQLTTPVTEDEALQTILGLLTAAGFQATSWQTGSAQLTIIRLFAKVYALLSGIISAIASGGFTGLATGNWLTLVARYFYDLERLDAQATIGKVLLTSSAGAPVLTFAAGDLKVSDQPSGTVGANVYTNTAGGTLGPNSTLLVEFEADVAGAAANIAPGTTLYWWTPTPIGVTPTNPVVTGTSTWITTPGADEESDGRLLARCLGRWAKLTYANTDGAYIGWALDALPALTRATIAGAPGDGTVTLIGATALGPIDAGQITTIENYVNGVLDGIGRRPLNDIFTATPATTVTTPTISITAYCAPSAPGVPDAVASAPANITNALLSYINSLPIGGTRLTGTQGRVLFSRLMTIAQEQPGVRSVVFAGLSADIMLSADQIYAPTINVTAQPVAPGA